ncbi:MAG: hypothetical protein HY267_04070 [Deltaproteobacteria bacterium]|nr:hypothetical protein [Deltaproteobacteria bacterium]
MKFSEIVAQTLVWLQRDKRVSYRALKLEFDLNEEQLDALKEELIEAKRVSIDENGKVLVWTGATTVLSSESRVLSSEEEGIAQMRQGLAAYRATGAELQRPSFLALLAEAHGKVGQAEEGLTVVAEALAMVDGTGERFYEAELYRVKGELLLAQADKLRD